MAPMLRPSKAEKTGNNRPVRGENWVCNRQVRRPRKSAKYGVTTQIPTGWRLALREKDDRVFVAVIAQDDPDRPGIAACELGLAPESVEDYRTRIDSNARQHGRPSGKLASNRVINDARGERLETVWEFHLSARASIVSANFPAPRRGERERRCDDPM